VRVWPHKSTLAKVSADAYSLFVLKGWGIAFIIFGIFWTFAGFFTVSGINMFGIGLLMVGVDSKLKDIAGKVKE
jgi:membrane-bound ClpP family serine protease